MSACGRIWCICGRPLLHHGRVSAPAACKYARALSRQQAFGLAQPQSEHQTQHQGDLDCQIGITRLAAACLAPESIPTIQRFRCHPQCQTATSAKACFVLGPIRYLELHLPDAMTAGGIMFERHDRSINLIALLAPLPTTPERSVHQRPVGRVSPLPTEALAMKQRRNRDHNSCALCSPLPSEKFIETAKWLKAQSFVRSHPR